MDSQILFSIHALVLILLFYASRSLFVKFRQSTVDFISNLAGVETTIDKEGGVVTIPGTDVKLDIPRGAFEEEISVQMRIVPRHLQDESELSFTSFSSVVVELLPDDTKLLLPAVLSLPHCLVLNENSEKTVTVYDSHHAKGIIIKYFMIKSPTKLICPLLLKLLC